MRSPWQPPVVVATAVLAIAAYFLVSTLWRFAAQPETNFGPTKSQLHGTVVDQLATIVGRVRSAAGEGLAGAKISVYQDWPQLQLTDWMTASVPSEVRIARRAVADAGGEFAVYRLWPRRGASVVVRDSAGVVVARHEVLDLAPAVALDIGDLATQEPRRVQGQVRLATGAPLVGAELRIVGDDEAEGLRAQLDVDRGLVVERSSPQDLELIDDGATTDADGSFALVTGLARPWLEVSHGGQALLRWQPDDLESSAQLELPPPRSVAGVVLDGDGLPLADAEVLEVGLGVARQPVVTASDGSFVCPLWRVDSDAVAVRGRPGEPWTLHRVTNGVPAALVTAPAATLMVRVAGETEARFEGLALRLVAGDLRNGTDVELSGRLSVERDRIVITGLSPGLYSLAGRALGTVMGVAVGVVGEDGGRATLRLPPAVPLEFRATNAVGAPIRGGPVVLIASGRGLPPLTLGVTDEHGALTAMVAPGPVRVLFEHPRFGARLVPTEAPGPVEMVFGSPGEIDGKVVGSAASVTILALSPPRRLRRVPVDANGRFLVPSLLPGRYRLQVEPAVPEQENTTVFVAAGRTVPVTLEVRQ